MSKNPSNKPNVKKSKSLARRRLLDLAGSLSGPPSRSTCTSGSADLLSEVDPDISTAPNSTSPSTSSADDSVADRHYNPDKDAVVLENDEEDDMDVDSDDPEEISPLVQAVKTHVRGCLREIPEPHHKDRKQNPVWNYFKKKITVDKTDGFDQETIWHLSSYGGGSNLWQSDGHASSFNHWPKESLEEYASKDLGRVDSHCPS